MISQITNYHIGFAYTERKLEEIKNYCHKVHATVIWLWINEHGFFCFNMLTSTRTISHFHPDPFFLITSIKEKLSLPENMLIIDMIYKRIFSNFNIDDELWCLTKGSKYRFSSRLMNPLNILNSDYSDLYILIKNKKSHED